MTTIDYCNVGLRKHLSILYAVGYFTLHLPFNKRVHHSRGLSKHHCDSPGHWFPVNDNTKPYCCDESKKVKSWFD